MGGGRGKGKGTKQSFTADLGVVASGEEGKLPARRRGRPLKLQKDETGEEGKTVVLSDEDGDDVTEVKKSSVLSKSSKNHQSATENGRKRKRPSQVEESESSVSAQSGITNKTNDVKLINACVRYRPNGSRRKNNKPRRAAEVGFDF